MILRAKYIAPVDGPVIEDGFVATEGGRVVDVGRWGSSDAAGGGVTDLGEVVLTPGLVNAHTHLELSYLHGRVPPGDDLIDWLRRVFELAVQSPVDDAAVVASVRDGVAASLAAGVTFVGDISRRPGVVRPVLTDSRLSGVSFGEVVSIGTRRGLLEERLNAACAAGAEALAGRGGGGSDASFSPPRWTIGVSPHAPYTVEVDALRECGRRARAHELPLCIHLLESPHEEAFTRDAAGPFREYLQQLGVWDDGVPSGGGDPIEVCERAGLLGPRTIAAHVNYVTDAQLARLAATGTHVAYCPRTHAAFGHAPHRCREMRAAGVNVCIGTDSLASNPSLSVMDELRFLHGRGAGLSPSELLRLGTGSGATALGAEMTRGWIRSGASADMVAWPLDPRGSSDPLENVFESEVGPCGVMAQGVRAFGNM